MIDYLVKYVNSEGEHIDYEITSTDTRTAMNNVFELRPDAKRIISCTRKPMFDD